MRFTDQPARSQRACFRTSSPRSRWNGPPSISMINRSRGPAEVGFLAGDPEVQPREWVVGGSQDLHRAHLGAAPSAFERKSGIARDRPGEASRSPAAWAPTEPLDDRREGDQLEPHGLADAARQSPIADPTGEVEQGAKHRRDRDPSQLGPVPCHGGTTEDEHVAEAPRTSAAGSGDDLKLSRQIPESPRSSGARMAEDAAGCGQCRAHPAPPVIVPEHRCDREHALFNGDQRTCGQAVHDRVVTHPEPQQLPARHAIELPAGQLEHTNVPHTPLEPVATDVRPPLV